MQIVPVIDLMGGVVVHARRGERERYRPLVSTLCQGAEPLTVAQALMKLHAFRALYIADLDAIRGNGDNRNAIAQIAGALPELDLWIDAGVATRAQFDALCARHACVPVVGSESLNDIAWLAELYPQQAIFSLDHRDGARLGPAELWQQPQLWPARVLAMNLSRVGADEGPDLALIQSLQRTRAGVQIYAAGGVRNEHDLRALGEIRAAGALVASALHSGAISAHEITLSSPHVWGEG